MRLIASVPGYAGTAEDLRRLRIYHDPRLADRAVTTLRGAIRLGSAPFAGTAEQAWVGLAGTLIHEHWHTRQHPLLKSWSFWAGVCTRTHPMRRYEWPAYRRQAQFLQSLADVRPELRPQATAEREAALASFFLHYGPPHRSSRPDS